MAEQGKKPASKKKPSLLEPDFTGLWDTALIGKENDWWHKSWGLGCQLLFLSCWVFGGTFPIWILLLLYLRWHITLLILVFLMSYSYVFEVNGWTWACRNLILAGSYYYDGGCSMSGECPPEGYQQKHSEDRSKHTPCMACVHPHGMFSQGFVFNAGLRDYVARSESDIELRKYYIGRKWDDLTDVWGSPPFHIGLVADSLTKMPLFRHLLMKWSQSITSAKKENVLDLMSKGQSFGLLPGGFYEASFMIRNREQIYIKVE